MYVYFTTVLNESESEVGADKTVSLCTIVLKFEYVWTDTCVGVGSVWVTCRLEGTDCLCGTGGNVAEAACTTFKACWGIWTTWDSGLDWTSWTCCTIAGCPGLCTISRLLPACKYRNRRGSTVAFRYEAFNQHSHLEWCDHKWGKGFSVLGSRLLTL